MESNIVKELKQDIAELAERLENALGEDIDNDQYADVKYHQGMCDTLLRWLKCDPGILMRIEISKAVAEVEKFIEENLPAEGEDDDT